MCSGCLNLRFCVYKLSEITLILLAVSPTLAGHAWPRQGQPWMERSSSERTATQVAAAAETSPVFDITPSSQGLTVVVGQTALLPCVVRNLGDKLVSWIRKRDLHILTSGIHSFTSDSRFEVVHNWNSDFWGLKIKKTQLSDAGKYECQVNTDPKINNALMLRITDSHMHDSPMDDSSSSAFGRSSFSNGHDTSAASIGVGNVATMIIQGGREQYVRAGSTITFTCVVSRTPRTLSDGSVGRRAVPITHTQSTSRAQLKWTHAGRDVTFQSSRGGISVDSDYREELITSRLTVAMVTDADAGMYSCDFENVKSATVQLLVVEGGRTEAMQRDPPNDACSIPSHRLLPLLLPFLILYFNWVLRSTVVQ